MSAITKLWFYPFMKHFKFK